MVREINEKIKTGKIQVLTVAKVKSSGKEDVFKETDTETVSIFASNTGLDEKMGVDTGMTIGEAQGVLATRDEGVSIGGSIPRMISVLGEDDE